MRKYINMIFSVFIFIVFLFSLLPTGFSNQEIILNSISDRSPGEDVVVSGQTIFDEIVIKILRPNFTVLYINTLKGKNFNDKFTLPSDSPEGTYSVVAGKGSIVDVKTFKVVKKQSALSSPEVLMPVIIKEGEKQSDVESSQKEESKQIGKNDLSEVIVDNNGTVKLGTSQVSKETLNIEIDKTLVQKAVQITKNQLLLLDLKLGKPLIQYTITFPAEVFTASFPLKEVLIATDNLNLKLPTDLLATENIDKNKPVEILIKKLGISNIPSEIQKTVGQKPVYEIELYQSSKKLNVSKNTNSIKVSVAYIPEIKEINNVENLVLYRVKDDGKVEVISNSKYIKTLKSVVGNVSSFSKFAVGIYVTKEFDDLKNYSWAQKAISSLAARNIISGVTPKNFKPQEYIKRGEFVKWLVNTLDLDAQYSSNFEDVAKDSGYWRELAIAKTLGIAKGYANRFRPENYITRQDMMVLVGRALEVANKPIVKTKGDLVAKFSDSSHIFSYARESISVLIANDLIKGNNKNQILPQKFATRAESAQLLFNIFFKWE